MKEVVLLTGLPTIAVIGETVLNPEGVIEMARWVKDRRPECLPDEYDDPDDVTTCQRVHAVQIHGSVDMVWLALFPHHGKRYTNPDEGLTDNELLVELAGRKCYDSFGLKAGRKSNAEYIEHTQQGEVPHRSIMYHAKMTFFIAGISRRVSHEFIRNYVGSDRNEEGAPSQESTRYTEHHGRYVVHPRDLRPRTPTDPSVDTNDDELVTFEDLCRTNYNAYLGYIARQNALLPPGEPPKGLARKRILEAASQRLMHSVETSFVWTTNPAALTKMLIERDNPLADLEFQRFARYLKLVCVRRWPNLFPRFSPSWHAAGDLNDPTVITSLLDISRPAVDA